MTNDSLPLIEELEADPRVRSELAAARLASTVGALMEQVAKATSAKGKEIAELMGVSPGRVSQILSGDGNVRIATLARFLDACGYELELVARPKAGRGSSITLPRSPRSRSTRSPDETDSVKPSVGATRTEVSTARKVGFSFVTVDGVSLVGDRAHEIFPSEVVERPAVKSTPWETVS